MYDILVVFVHFIVTVFRLIKPGGLRALAQVAASGKNVTTIYLTHGHGDHFFGIGALLDRFPNARAGPRPML